MITRHNQTIDKHQKFAQRTKNLTYMSEYNIRRLVKRGKEQPKRGTPVARRKHFGHFPTQPVTILQPLVNVPGNLPR